MPQLICLVPRLPIDVWTGYHMVLYKYAQPYDALPFHDRLQLADAMWDYATDCISRAMRIRNHVREYQPHNADNLTAEADECEMMHTFIHTKMLQEFPDELRTLIGDEPDDNPDPDDYRDDDDNWHADDEIDEDCYRFPHQ